MHVRLLYCCFSTEALAEALQKLEARELQVGC